MLKKTLIPLFLITGLIACDNKDTRLSNPYWGEVMVDFAGARDDNRKNQSHIIQGTGFEIRPQAGLNELVEERKDGLREAYISLVGKLPFRWIVDCENKKLKEVGLAFEKEEERGWEDVMPNTNGARVVVYICKLPASRF
jgi:hypothetical protein